MVPSTDINEFNAESAFSDRYKGNTMQDIPIKKYIKIFGSENDTFLSKRIFINIIKIAVHKAHPLTNAFILLSPHKIFVLANTLVYHRLYGFHTPTYIVMNNYFYIQTLIIRDAPCTNNY